jgi:Na+-driven multidrug efflux pump
MPFSYYFAFTKDLGLMGVWFGPLIGSLVGIGFYITLVYYVLDWNLICKEIHELMLKNQKNNKKSEL